MTNMMPGSNVGAEPREHYDDCASMCEFPRTRDDDGEGNENWECAMGHYHHTCNCDEIEIRLHEARNEV